MSGTAGAGHEDDEDDKFERGARMNAHDWHIAEDDLREYSRGGVAPPRLWSVETHLAACAHCRARLTGLVDPALVEEGWARLDAAVDAPRAGLFESALLRLGVPDHSARLLAATPVLRRSWLGAVVLTLLLTVAVGHATRGVESPLLFLAAAPLLPLAGVAVSFGPGLDPMYETAVVAPMHTFRLLMVRTVAVLVTTTTLSSAASLALPSFGLVTLGWLLPALALTSTGLALMPRLGTVWAPVLVGAAWTGAVLFGQLASSGTPAPFTGAGQLASAAAAVAASAALVATRHRFDSSRHLSPSFPFASGRAL